VPRRERAITRRMANNPNEIKLGDRVRDVYSKYQGIAIARSEFLYGCSRICIEPEELDKDGKMKDAMWFDEQRVELIEALGLRVTVSGAHVKTGGPQRDATRAPDAKR
jgi:hypothetical protein